MRRKEIPIADWAEFLQELSRSHEESWADLEVVGGAGAAAAEQHVVFQEIALEQLQEHGGLTVVIRISPERHPVRVVPEPESISVTRLADGETLEIQGRGGLVVRLRFRSGRRYEADVHA